MNKEIIFSGIGGQGCMAICEMLCTVAADKGYLASFTPFYGQEKRGGRTMAEMIISSKIGSIVVSAADLFLALDQKSVKDFTHRVAPGGVMIYNSSMIAEAPQRDDIKIYSIAANDIAQELGAVKAANMVALGAALNFLPELADIADFDASIEAQFEGKTAAIEINKKALVAGYQAIRV